jgi:hypothetical protein
LFDLRLVRPRNLALMRKHVLPGEVGHGVTAWR